jgi:hypothetical protein
MFLSDAAFISSGVPTTQEEPHMARNDTTGAEGRDHVQLSVRVPTDLVEALTRVAAEQDRTVSAELRRMIRRHVGDREGAVSPS